MSEQVQTNTVSQAPSGRPATLESGNTQPASLKPRIAPGPPRRGVEREFTIRERSQLEQAARRFMRHRLAVASLIVFLLIVLLAFIVPLFWKYTYATITPDNSQPPSLKHPFGT